MAGVHNRPLAHVVYRRRFPFALLLSASPAACPQKGFNSYRLKTRKFRGRGQKNQRQKPEGNFHLRCGLGRSRASASRSLLGTAPKHVPSPLERSVQTSRVLPKTACAQPWRGCLYGSIVSCWRKIAVVIFSSSKRSGAHRLPRGTWSCTSAPFG